VALDLEDHDQRVSDVVLIVDDEDAEFGGIVGQSEPLKGRRLQKTAPLSNTLM
jgi:hypothetical protein